MIVYRIDTRKPEDILIQGFQSRGYNISNLRSHVKSPKDDSGFISTSCLNPFQMTHSSLFGFIQSSALNNAALNLPQYTSQQIIAKGLTVTTIHPHQWFYGTCKSYIYKINVDDRKVINVNEQLGSDSVFSDQHEIAIKHKVHSYEIVGYYEITTIFPEKKILISDMILDKNGQ